MVECDKPYINGSAKMKIIIMDNAREIGKAVGKLFVDAINEKPNITLGLATGARKAGFP